MWLSVVPLLGAAMKDPHLVVTEEREIRASDDGNSDIQLHAAKAEEAVAKSSANRRKQIETFLSILMTYFFLPPRPNILIQTQPFQFVRKKKAQVR